MRPLIIDAAARERAAQLIAHAELHRHDVFAMYRRLRRKDPPPGDLPEFQTWLDVGFKVVFTVEQHVRRPGPPAPWFRHLSVSVDSADKYPAPLAIEEIMRLFGFRGRLQDCIAMLEENVQAVNVLEPLEPLPLKESQ